MGSTMQLEFSQAMSDFKTMFPDMDRDVIEAVLRANQGAVDATIDQLLAMSTDNQNEKLRQELDGTVKEPTAKLISPKTSPMSDRRAVATPQLQNAANMSSTTGASPKVKKLTNPVAVASPSRSAQHVAPVDSKALRYQKKWEPPLLGPLPPTFLRITAAAERSEFDLGDEQFAMMLQNEEFMAELRYNQEFLTALEKDHGKVQDDAAFKEKIRHMGKVSRKKFAQLAHVFKWQRNKKPSAVRHPDSLLLQEEHSDEDEPTKQQQLKNKTK